MSFRASVLAVALSMPILGTACGGTAETDQSRAEIAVVRPSDLQGEWTEETADGTFRCASFDSPALVITGRAQSAFALWAVGSVTSFAAVYEAEADEAFESFVERATSCSKEYAQQLLEEPAQLLRGVPVEDLSPEVRALLGVYSLAVTRVREISLPPMGDESHAYGITVGRSLGPVGVELSPFIMAFIRSGRTVAFLFVSSIGGLDDEFLVQLAETVASRM